MQRVDKQHVVPLGASRGPRFSGKNAGTGSRADCLGLVSGCTFQAIFIVNFSSGLVCLCGVNPARWRPAELASSSFAKLICAFVSMCSQILSPFFAVLQ